MYYIYKLTTSTVCASLMCTQARQKKHKTNTKQGIQIHTAINRCKVMLQICHQIKWMPFIHQRGFQEKDRSPVKRKNNQSDKVWDKHTKQIEILKFREKNWQEKVENYFIWESWLFLIRVIPPGWGTICDGVNCYICKWAIYYPWS